MLNFQNVLPAILGLAIGLTWITARLGWLEKIKIKTDEYKIIIPGLMTVTLPFILTYIFNLIKDFDLSSNLFTKLQNLSPLGTFIIAFTAFLTYFTNQRNKHDEETTKQAILILERAYEILTNNGNHTKPPLPNRFTWLRTARTLKGYEELKKELKIDLYKKVCETQEEYWQHQFYLLIENYQLYPVSYFESKQNCDCDDGLQIQPQSAVTIYGFAALGCPGLAELKDTDTISNRLAGNIGMHDGLFKYLQKYIYTHRLRDDLLFRAFIKAIENLNQPG